MKKKSTLLHFSALVLFTVALSVSAHSQTDCDICTSKSVCLEYDESCGNIDPNCTMEICYIYSFCQDDGAGGCLPGSLMSNYVCHTFSVGEQFCFELSIPEGYVFYEGDDVFTFQKSSDQTHGSVNVSSIGTCLNGSHATPIKLTGTAHPFTGCNGWRMFICEDENGNYFVSCDFFPSTGQ